MLLFRLFFQLLLQLLFQHKRSEIVIDEAKLKPNEGKIIGVWSWKSFRTEKYVVYLHSDGKIRIKKVGD